MSSVAAARTARLRHRPKGRVITFYSYKGGTGRSMAVANVAWILAMSGERVLLVDWDLEAPGIHRYFHPFLDDKELTSTVGLLDFVENLQARAVTNATLGADDVDAIEYVKTLKWPVDFSVQWERFGPFAGIDLLAAGRQGPAYSRKLNTFNWVDFYEKLGGSRLLEIAGQQLKSVYDYVLIDSRTGVSDTSGICTVEMPDTLVVCFTLNDQSINGASGVAESVRLQRKQRAAARTDILPSSTAPPAAAEFPFRIFPVPTRVEIGSEREKRQVALAVAQQKFASFLDHLGADDTPGKYWGRVQLAYFAFYAFEEIPAIFGDPADEELSLMTPLKRITRAITGDASLVLKPLADEDDEAERLRKQILGWYLRKAGTVLEPVQLAQRVYDELDREGQSLMRTVLLRLVQVVPGAAPSAATVQVEDFDGQLGEMVQRLASAGVVQISGAGVSIVDRSIVEVWDRLRQWLNEDEAFLHWRQNLSGSVRSWQRTGRDKSALLRGKVLEEAMVWLERNPGEFNGRELDFLTASREEEGKEWATSSMPPSGTSVRYKIRFWGSIALGVIILAVAGIMIGQNWTQSERERSQRAAAIVTLAGEEIKVDPLLSALLLAELKDYAASEDDRKFALQVAASEYPEAVIRGNGAYRSLEYAHDGSRFVTAGDSGVDIWAANTWKRIGSIAPGAMISASFNGWIPERAKSRGGSGEIDKVVTTGADGVVTVWTLNGKLVMQFAGANPQGLYFGNCSNRHAQKKPPLTGMPGLGKPVYARFSPDEVVVVVAYAKGTLLMVDAKSGTCFDVYTPKSEYPAAFSPDGEWVATAGPADLTLFHVQDWKEDFYKLSMGPQMEPRPLAISFSRQVLMPSGVFDPLKFGSSLGFLIDVGSFRWDAKYMVGGWNASVYLAAIPGEGQRNEMLGHTGRITSAVFDPSGAHVLTASEDKTVRIWPIQKKPPNPVSTWSELATYLRNSARACLTADQRNQYLREDPKTAADNAQSCEAQYQ